MVRIDSEVRQRRRFIDHSLETAIGLLKTPTAQRMFGALAVQRADFFANNFVAVDIHDGKAKLPRIQDEQIPVIAVREGEVVRFDPKLKEQTPRQADKTRELLAGSSDPRNPGLNDFMNRLSFEYGADELRMGTARGVVVSARMIYEFPSKNKMPLLFNISGRPLVAFKYGEGAARINPSTVIHEGQHVVQRLTQPVEEVPLSGDWSDVSLRTELEAYHFQTLGIKTMHSTGYRPGKNEYVPYTVEPDGRISSHVILIDNLRRQTNEFRRDKFFPNQGLHETFARIGLDAIYLNQTGAESS